MVKCIGTIEPGAMPLESLLKIGTVFVLNCRLFKQDLKDQADLFTLEAVVAPQHSLLLERDRRGHKQGLG